MSHRGYTNKNDVPRTQRTGKHSRDPGWQSGNHWVVCDLCGCDVRAHEAIETWDHKVVCPSDWEPRHEQDFVRSREDKTTAEGLVRPDPEALFIFFGSVCTTNAALAGFGQAGCATVGVTELGALVGPSGTISPIPPPTFGL
jgi:hypothetical protein